MGQVSSEIMESYPPPQSPPVVQDPARQASWEGYITLISTLLPALRGRHARPGEINAAWTQLRNAVAASSDEAKKLLRDLPAEPTADDLAPLTAELGRVARIRTQP